MSKLTNEGFNYFVPGVSTYEFGTKLNEGLFNYKTSLGCGVMIQDVYRKEM
jgi:hypothetical protein